MYSDVSFPISSWQVFTYSVPGELKNIIQIGSRVRAPLGRRKNVQGVVVGLEEQARFKGRIQPISEVVDDVPLIDETLWQLLSWVSRYYLTPIGQVMRSAVPSRLTKNYKAEQLLEVSTLEVTSAAIQKLKQKAPKQYELLTKISDMGGNALVRNLSHVSSRASAVCRALEQKGFVKLKAVVREPSLGELKVESARKDVELTAEQKQISDVISIPLMKGNYGAFLFHGVTGSGKTEVYIHLAKTTEKLGRTSIILLPEISLTPQIAGRFCSVFGDKVAIWHSRMTVAERGWTWRQICEGKCSIVVGARSAIFAPVKNVGLIVVDEEQEGSYKQESPAPRYHARDVALMRGKLSKAVTLLAGATPSMESFYNQSMGKLDYLRLTSRFGNAIYPQVHVVDMKKEREVREDYSVILSRLLSEKIAERLDKKEQVILLQNRRGFAPVVICRDCGETEMCKLCQISLTFHKTDHLLKCHYCDANRSVQTCCGKCGGAFRLGGTGTQKVEEILVRKFPNIRYVRMDLDTTRRKGTYAAILNKFARGEYDVLLGTQMIAKGLDFPNVTLVGVVNADTGLFLPDFRAGERTFQLIYQVAGRSGRGDKPGEAVIQTSHGDDPAIKSASQLNFDTYYNICLNERKELMYPPFSWMSRVELSGKDRAIVQSRADSFVNQIKDKPKGIEIIGPAPCPLERIRGQFRYQVILKSPKNKDKNGERFHAFLRYHFGDGGGKQAQSGVKMTIDIDPISLL
ncbi:MAG: primosomal protein N' [Candidatus Neomarinimicrobiota bacterium]|nr:primosomal protein N' [Candidatus Neomarinimicrobiota bacterium]